MFDIIATIDKILAPLSKEVRIKAGWYDENIKKTHITFCELGDYTEDNSDDEEESITHTVQVDVWGTDDEETLKYKLICKDLLLKNGFTYTAGENLWETLKDGKILYHKAIKLKYLEILQE